MRAKIPHERNCVRTLYCITVPIVLEITTIYYIPRKAKSHKKQMKSTIWSDPPSFGRSAQKKHCPDFKYAPGMVANAVWSLRKNLVPHALWAQIPCWGRSWWNILSEAWLSEWKYCSQVWLDAFSWEVSDQLSDISVFRQLLRFKATLSLVLCLTF